MTGSRDVKTHESTGAEMAGGKTSRKSPGEGNRGNADTSRSPKADMASMPDQATDVVGQVQQQASSIVGMANQKASSQLTMQKDQAATTLGIVASALHEAGKQLRQQDDVAPLAGYVDAAADQVDRVSTMLREQDLNQIVESTAQFARRQPVLFLAGAITLGFLATRFLKSSGSTPGQRFDRANRGAMNSGTGWAGNQGGKPFSGAGEFGGGMNASPAMDASRQAGFAGSSAASSWPAPPSAGSGAEGF